MFEHRSGTKCLFTEAVCCSADVQFSYVSIVNHICLAMSSPRTAGYRLMHSPRFDFQLHMFEHRVSSIRGQLNSNDLFIICLVAKAAKQDKLKCNQQTGISQGT